MKRLALVILAVALFSSVSVASAGGGLDAWFHVDPGCVVEITPYADYEAGRLGPRTFNLSVVSVDGVMVSRRTLPGEAWYKTVLWCPDKGIVDTATLFIPGRASGKADFWFPLHNQELWKCGPWAVYDGLK